MLSFVQPRFIIQESFANCTVKFDQRCVCRDYSCLHRYLFVVGANVCLRNSLMLCLAHTD